MLAQVGQLYWAFPFSTGSLDTLSEVLSKIVPVWANSYACLQYLEYIISRFMCYVYAESSGSYRDCT